MSTDAHLLELLLPHEITAELAHRSMVYVPLGTYEFHGAHLPVGLDALTAHGICLEAARREGGLVCPPFYYGTGGGHSAYPWTIMLDTPDGITAILEKTLVRLQDFGVATAVLMSGHFAGEQIDMIETLARNWAASGNPMRVLAFGVNMPTLAMPPDHAGLFETTLLGALWPDRVHVERLPPLATAPSIDLGGDSMGAQRHDPAHPLYGIFGPDPRFYDPAAASPLLAAMVDWLLANVR